MSDGFFYWYSEPHDKRGVERLLHALEAYGVHLAHPTSHAITTITDGPDSWGEQLPVERGELVELLTLTDRPEVNFQLWLNEETDMFTRFRRLGAGRVVIEFGLDGMSPAEQERAIRAASHAVSADRDRTWGLVIDRRGLTEETDWDRVMQGGQVLLPRLPDLLGVRPEVATAHSQLSATRGEMEPPLVVFRGDGSETVDR
ncbi:hypothetical protein N4P33_02330 [Streptomyces sp. 15-116A]|uniref:hypothetical protein n=1 Tax=Streptomyces sp. 15-116A TaxID=2259035 RepID=UPI0021B240EB|nr:hypothetical protein [Streptomyces sp. 15-116A]MCT7351017.1 hypothetical protein [Streptomyces sp. 15-116A]